MDFIFSHLLGKRQDNSTTRGSWGTSRHRGTHFNFCALFMWSKRARIDVRELIPSTKCRWCDAGLCKVEMDSYRFNMPLIFRGPKSLDCGRSKMSIFRGNGFKDGTSAKHIFGLKRLSQSNNNNANENFF